MNRSRRWGAAVAAVLVVGACGARAEPVIVAPEPDAVGGGEPTLVPEPQPTPTTPPAPSPTATPLPPATPVAATPSPTPEPSWSLEILAIDDGLAAAMTPTSWREGCPVGLDELRLLRFPHVDFDGAVAQGELIVHARWAEAIGRVFEQLFAARYPIQRIELVDVYGGDDLTSMRANNTSGFNCREVGTGTGVWSNHAFGTAVDVNPLMNPLVQGSFVDPPEGEVYLDRGDVRLGMIVEDDAAVQAFGSIGWVWGGTWRTLKDYQHFSDDGR